MSRALLAPRRARRLSLTALIDVVFILLLFFMVTSVFQRDATIALPTAAGTAAADAPRPQVVAVDAGGQLRSWGDANAAGDYRSIDPVFWSTFDLTRPLVLRPAADCTVEMLVAVLEAARGAGFETVSLGPTWEAAP